jgi:hypothetical protein
MAFGFNSFASAAFSDLGTQQFNVEVNVTGQELQHVLESFVGVEAGGNISIPVFEGPISIVLQNVFVEADGQVEVIGQEITSVLGNEIIVSDGNVSLTGFGLTVEENSVGIEASGNISIPVFENPMSINLGNTNEIGTGEVFPTGEELTFTLNSIAIETIVDVNVTGIEALMALNGVTFKIDSTVTLNGLSMTNSLGSLNNSYGWNIIDTGTSVVYTLIAA